MENYKDFAKEGTVPFSIPSIESPCYTYYKIFGNLRSGLVPVVVLHGGPGSGHEYCLPFSKLWSLRGIPVVLYDQIGCAASTHLRHTEGDHSFWQPKLFVAELQNLLSHLGLDRSDGPGYDILGHSWGGMLASEFACHRPPGLRRLIIAGSPADSQIFYKDLWNLKKQLPLVDQQAIDEAIQKDDFAGKAYLDAMTTFLKTFLCRADLWPPEELAIDFQNHADDITVRRSMQGRSPWLYNGSLQNWSIIPSLPRINVPTLVFNGEFDTAQHAPTVPFFEHIPDVRWITLAGASHMPHLDSPEMQEKVLKLVGDFLQQE